MFTTHKNEILLLKKKSHFKLHFGWQPRQELFNTFVECKLVCDCLNSNKTSVSSQ